MSYTTMSNIKAEMRTNVMRSLYESESTRGVAKFEKFSDFENAIDSLDVQFDEVIYLKDAIDICNNSDFFSYHEEKYDFSSCNSYEDCAMLQARAIFEHVQMDALNEICAEITAEAKEFFDYVEENMYDEDHNVAQIHLTTSDPYGWAAHDFETESSINVHTNLENELYAVSFELYSYCFYAAIDKNDRVK
ncbi:MAG: hypothetical protein ACRDCE_07895 [Cetobacterium sp.]|uniref:hypothetical protein n=1 Tax=Cetobacterium sp. TaxID=2071632 RepID=UPI003EE4B506